MADDPTSEENPASVGYRRPPAGVRFQKGQSGNPTGRRKGSKNRPQPSKVERLRSLMLEEAYRPIKVNQDGREVLMPMAQAVLRSLAVAAAKGEARAQAMFIKIVSATEEDEAAIEEMLEEAHAETAQQPIEITIVDAVDGRPAGKREVIYPYNGHPEPKVGKGK